jgi:hypothetical protein
MFQRAPLPHLLQKCSTNVKNHRRSPKVNKSGLKRSAEPGTSAKQKCREDIIADSYPFL